MARSSGAAVLHLRHAFRTKALQHSRECLGRLYSQQHAVTFLPVQRRTSARTVLLEELLFCILASPFVFWLFAPRVEVPVTGRRQIMALPLGWDHAMGEALAESARREAHFAADHAHHKLVVKVARQLAAEADAMGMGITWRLVVVPNAEKNASCAPGGHITVHEGLLDWIEKEVQEGTFADMEAPLAAVLAHEMGHALARHGAERLSFLPFFAPLAMLSASSPLLPQLVSLFLSLPHSRLSEAEADEIGFYLFARGTRFDLEAYPLVFSALCGDAPSAAWLDTHPSGPQRRAATALLLPAMREERELALQGVTTHSPVPRESAWVAQLFGGFPDDPQGEQPS